MKTYKLKLKTVALIRRMIEEITAKPESLNQSRFPAPEHGGVCTSAFCAAGHLIMLAKPKRFKELCKKAYDNSLSVQWDEEAAKVIGLPEDMRTEALFGTAHSWPYKFYGPYAKATGLKTLAARNRGLAKAFAARWEGFIASGGADALPYYKKELKEYRENYGRDYVSPFKFEPEVAA